MLSKSFNESTIWLGKNWIGDRILNIWNQLDFGFKHLFIRWVKLLVAALGCHFSCWTTFSVIPLASVFYVWWVLYNIRTRIRNKGVSCTFLSLKENGANWDQTHACMRELWGPQNWMRMLMAAPSKYLYRFKKDKYIFKFSD